MHRLLATLILGVAVLFAATRSFACDIPRGQSFRQFYRANTFGQLGVKGLGQNFHILDQYKCYDLSFLIDKNLHFYFNYSGDDETAPTYVGALILRIFSGKRSTDLPFAAYFYRNTSEKDSSSHWARLKSGSREVDLGKSYSVSDLNFVDEYFRENERVPAEDLGDLSKLSRQQNSKISTQLNDWHALVVAKGDSEYRVFENTATADGWFDLDVSLPVQPSYAKLRSYLTKYLQSTSPRPKEFFSSGAQSADCVYIKLVAPGDAVSSFAIERPQNSRGFISLKMRKTAQCETP